jgi:hypothetical protein
MAAFERNNATTICAFCVETVTAGGECARRAGPKNDSPQNILPSL